MISLIVLFIAILMRLHAALGECNENVARLTSEQVLLTHSLETERASQESLRRTCERNFTTKLEEERTKWHHQCVKEEAATRNERCLEWQTEKSNIRNRVRQKKQKRAQQERNSRGTSAESERIRRGLEWGEPRAKSCVRFGAREYAAHLYHVPSEVDGLNLCMKTSISIRGHILLNPEWCEKTSLVSILPVYVDLDHSLTLLSPWWVIPGSYLGSLDPYGR
jgi:hypothetical protein